MPVFRRYNEARGAIFDLSHLGGLSAGRTLPLFVSPQTLYVLQNLAAADVEQSWRYAIELRDDGYLAVRPDDDDYVLFAQIANQVALQLMPELNMAGTLLNYKSDISSEIHIANAAAGQNDLTVGPVPDGETWVIDVISATDVDHAPTALVFRLYNDVVNIPLEVATAPGASVWVIRFPHLIMSPGWKIQAIFSGCTANDDLYFDVVGYSMSLVE
jgi:hypothetical protein